MINYLDQILNNAYSDLHSACLIPAFDGTGVSFSRKKIKGKEYIYVNAKIGKIPVQRYIGADTPDVQALIEKEKQLWHKTDTARVTRARLVKVLLAGGVMSLSPQEGRILRMLERAGVFLSGGVLIGTPAFNSMANLLGVTWTDQFITRDVDIASEAKLPVLVEPIKASLKSILENSGMGFIEIPTLNPKHPSTSFQIKGGDFKVELLTPQRGKPDNTPVVIPHLRAMADPLRFLDFLLEETQQAVVPFDIGVLVNVPDPARFALHKLVVSQRRPAAFASKAKKDIDQAAQLIEVLSELQPGSLYIAHCAAEEFGKKFFTTYLNATKLLPKNAQESLKQTLIDFSS